jgi:CelD/BcsL family acetyltransferase involved in cellulose biosynthesis
MYSRKVIGWNQWPAIRATWDSLCDHSPQGVFFLTADWVEAWIETFGDRLNPEFLLVESGGETVACCFLVRTNVWRKLVPFRRVHLNSASEDVDDHTAVEYNACLSLPGFESAAGEALAAHVAGWSWDEFLIDGAAPAITKYAGQLGEVERIHKHAQYVNLQRVRESGGTYDSVLSSNSRQQIRRSIKLYEESGPLAYREAATVDEAVAVLGELAALHQAAWTDRGKHGCFASANFTGFHQALIRKAFPRGRIRLITVKAAGQTIAALYNFIYRGRVYFYQSGLDYASDNRLKPGMVAHYLAIQECLKQPDLIEYDFLGGEHRYKKSLSTDERPLEWISVLRDTPRVRLFQLLRRLRQTSRGAAPSEP